MSTVLKKYRNQFLKFTAVFAVMFSIGYVSADYMITNDRPMQSFSMSSILTNAKMGKSLAFVNVQLEPIEIPDSSNEVAEISGYITLLKTSNGVINYKWLLPDGVEIVDGEKESQLSNVSPESPIQVKIKVTGYSKSEKKLISLSASTLIGENSFSNVAIMSSRPEDSQDYLAKQHFDSQQFNADRIQKMDLSSESGHDLRSKEKIQK